MAIFQIAFFSSKKLAKFFYLIKIALQLNWCYIYIDNINSMNFNHYTTKAAEAIQSAQEITVRQSHSRVTPMHLLYVLLRQEDGFVPMIVKKSDQGQNNVLETLLTTSAQKLASLSTISGANAQVGIDAALQKVLLASEDAMKLMGDQYLTTEHMIIALSKVDSDAQTLLKENGLTTHNIDELIKEVRKGKTVDSQNPEASFESLKKFGKDITELAEQGKLDPVIGRDDELRRTLQILSRRTKNNPVLVGEPGVGKTAIVELLAQNIVK